MQVFLVSARGFFIYMNIQVSATWRGIYSNCVYYIAISTTALLDNYAVDDYDDIKGSHTSWNHV